MLAIFQNVKLAALKYQIENCVPSLRARIMSNLQDSAGNDVCENHVK